MNRKINKLKKNCGRTFVEILLFINTKPLGKYSYLAEDKISVLKCIN